MPESYTTHIEEWRADRDESLRRENSWLALAGLFWLQKGVNRIGSQKDCAVVLPRSAPAHLGDIVFEHGQLHYRPAHGERALINGAAADHTQLHTDQHEHPSLITRDALSMLVIDRDGQLAVRVWDNARPQRTSFPPRRWFPIDEAYCLPARYTPHHEPKLVIITDVLGFSHETHMHGYLSFVLHNHVLKLDAIKFNHELLIRFKDLTNGKETYPAGRYLDAEMTDEENAILDFNMACSPPCAFTAFATCPLPHADNHLNIRVAAGEKYRKTGRAR